MSQQVDEGYKSVAAGAALAQYRRVVVTSGVLQYASATQAEDGTLMEATFTNAAFSSGFSTGTMRLRNSEGTFKMVASGAITTETVVYAAANGKISATGSIPIGKALEAATADGDVIEVVRKGTPNAGYETGAGGAVTQATNRSTGVTLSNITGAITTNTTSLAAAAQATFTVTNTLVAAGDVIVCSIKSGQTNKETKVYASAVAAGSFDLTVHNQHASTAEVGAIIINYAVIKGVAA